MRITYASTTHCAHLAKALKREVSGFHADITLSKCQNAVARIMGYRNWKELDAHCRPGTAESLLDEQVGEDEAALRIERQSLLLSEILNLPVEVAGAIVHKIRPTGRRDVALVKPVPAWRARFDAMCASHAQPGYAEERSAHLMERILGRFELEPVAWKSRNLDGVGEVRTFVRACDCSPGGFRFDKVEVAIVREGKVAAYLRGYVVIPDAYMREASAADLFEDVNEDFFHLADDIDDDIAEAAHALGEKGEATALFEHGSLFVLTDLRRDLSTTVKGVGEALLTGTIRMLNARRKGSRIRSLAGEILFEGYSDLEYNQRRVDPAWKAAQAHLTAWLTGLASLRAELGPNAVVVTFDTGPAGGGGNEGLALTNLHMPREDLREENEPPLFETARRTYAMVKFSGGKLQPEANHPGEPSPIGIDKYPSGFDALTAACFKRVSPHPDLWDHMPSEVVSLRVVPAGKPGPPGRPRLTVVARFENGSELSIPDAYLPGGEMFMESLPEITTASDTFVLKNQFTERLTVVGMQLVLALNGMLLFDGNPISEPVAMVEVVEVRRPDRRLAAVG